MVDRLQAAGGFHFPDYQGGSIVNLLSSIIHALEGVSPHPRLRAVDPRVFNGVSRIVYLLLDGVGYNQLRRNKRLLSFGALGRSAYSSAGTRWNGCGAYNTLCHRQGVHARKTRLHLAEIDASVGRLSSRLAGTGTLLLVTADHGVVDAPPPRRIDLATVPGLLDCLALLPAGACRHETA